MPKKNSSSISSALDSLTLGQKIALVFIIILGIGLPIFIVSIAAETRIDSQAASYNWNQMMKRQALYKEAQNKRSRRGDHLPVEVMPTRSQALQAPKVYPGCQITGCNNELCVNAGSEDVFSTCQYKEEFACYKSAECKQDATTGDCGWVETDNLRRCLGTGLNNQLEKESMSEYDARSKNIDFSY